MNERLKDLLIVWLLVLGPISILGSTFKACSAFYRQVIKHEPLIQLRVTPNMFSPCEGLDISRDYCGARKARPAELPQVETV